MHDVRVLPSILAADFARLGAQVEEVLDAGARVIHVDVMDGHFVPPITIGALIVDSLRELVHGRDAALDVHLMVERPERRLEAFVEAGADSIAVHWEATPHVHYALKAIREAGLAAGLAINPATPPEVTDGVSDELDHVLCMTVNPGWGGQTYIETSTAKIARLRELLGPDVPIEVDGGIDTGDRGGRGDAVRRRLVDLQRGRSRRGVPGDRGGRRRGLRPDLAVRRPQWRPMAAPAGSLRAEIPL
jgi:ribulose-phosphate 3-epimerase